MTDASESEIRKAYKHLALKWHPDKHANNEKSTEVSMLTTWFIPPGNQSLFLIFNFFLGGGGVDLVLGKLVSMSVDFEALHVLVTSPMGVHVMSHVSLVFFIHDISSNISQGLK